MVRMSEERQARIGMEWARQVPVRLGGVVIGGHGRIGEAELGTVRFGRWCWERLGIDWERHWY